MGHCTLLHHCLVASYADAHIWLRSLLFGICHEIFSCTLINKCMYIDYEKNKADYGRNCWWFKLNLDVLRGLESKWHVWEAMHLAYRMHRHVTIAIPENERLFFVPLLFFMGQWRCFCYPFLPQILCTSWKYISYNKN